MLLFAIKYQEAIDAMTKERKHGLRAFEMTDEEWLIVGHLHDTLKVCDSCFFFVAYSLPCGSPQGPQGCNKSLLI